MNTASRGGAVHQKGAFKRGRRLFIIFDLQGGVYQREAFKKRGAFIRGFTVIESIIYMKGNLEQFIMAMNRHSRTYLNQIIQYQFIIGTFVSQRSNYLNVLSATFLLVCFVCLKERTCETRKNIFCFISKALFVLEIIKFYIFRYSDVMTSPNP